MRFHIGTSGWSYPHWRGPFYPPDLPAARWLEFYARHFTTVELNSSFYRLPAREAFADWAARTPAGFLFSIKAPRAITHMKKLRDPGLSLPPFLGATAGLVDRAGPLLFQLPPRWRADPARLAAFLEALPADRPAAFEFRDPSWRDRAVLDLLARHGAAYCVHDLGSAPVLRAVTADFAYVRLHGPDQPYRGRYGTRRLAGWARWLSGLDAATAYVYFDNDEAGHAPADARELADMLA